MDRSHLKSCLVTAEKLKAEGNELFSQKEFQKALGKYTRILAYVTGMKPTISTGEPPITLPSGQMVQMGDPNQGLYNKGQQLEEAAYSNIAACYLQLQNYPNVVSFCTKALRIQPAHVKCLYRRAKAYYHLGQYDKAAADMDSLQKSMDTLDHHTKQLQSLIKAKQEKQDKVFASTFQKAFQENGSK